MDHTLAAAIISSMCEISQEVHRPLEGDASDLAPSELEFLKLRITEVWGSAFDIMMPLVRAFPDLDPDQARQRTAQAGDTTKSAQVVPRLAVGSALVDAADAADSILKGILGECHSRLNPDEADRYQAQGRRVQREVDALRKFGQSLTQHEAR